MPQLSDLLDRAVGSLEPTFGTQELERRARSRRTRRRGAQVLATVLAGVLVTGSVVAIADGGNDRAVVATASGGRVFPEKTGTVLAFSDGLDGLLLVDLDHSRAVRYPLGGSFPNEGSGWIRVRDSFIVRDEQGIAQAVPIDGSARTALGSTVLAFDNHSPEGVWLVDWRAGAISSVSDAQFRFVRLDGTVRVTALPDSPDLVSAQAAPVSAFGDKIIFEANGGLLVWDTATDDVTTIGVGGAFVGDVSGRGLVSWCPDACTELHVANLIDNSDRVVARTHSPHSFDARQSRFSPNGRSLAVMKGLTNGLTSPDSKGDFVLVDVARGTHETVARHIARFAYFGWASDGRAVYFSQYSYMQPTTDIGRYDLDRHHVERVTLPIGSVLAFETLGQREARALLDAPDEPKRDCKAPTFYPSGRTSSCGFRF